MDVNKAFFYQEKECPICLNKIVITRIRSSAIRLKERESDFNLIYRTVNPIHYAVWVCPTCSFAVLDAVFDKEIPKHEKELLVKGLYMLKEEEPDFSGERSLPVALRSYELAIRTSQIRHSSKGTQAPLFLRAAWIAREMQKPDIELPYLDQARKLFEGAFGTEREVGGKLSQAALMYLIGELNRRLGQYEDAIRWFARSVGSREIRMEPEVERMARMQWELAKDQYKSGETVDFNASASTSALSSETATPASEEKEKQPEAPLPALLHVDPFPANRNRRKVKLMASLYQDQVEWLQSLGSQCQKKHGKLLEREAILRGLLDGLMAAQPDLPDFQDEESLRQAIYTLLKK